MGRGISPHILKFWNLNFISRLIMWGKCHNEDHNPAQIGMSRGTFFCDSFLAAKHAEWYRLVSISRISLTRRGRLCIVSQYSLVAHVVQQGYVAQELFCRFVLATRRDDCSYVIQNLEGLKYHVHWSLRQLPSVDLVLCSLGVLLKEALYLKI